MATTHKVSCANNLSRAGKGNALNGYTRQSQATDPALTLVLTLEPRPAFGKFPTGWIARACAFPSVIGVYGYELAKRLELSVGLLAGAVPENWQAIAATALEKRREACQGSDLFDGTGWTTARRNRMMTA